MNYYYLYQENGLTVNVQRQAVWWYVHYVYIFKAFMYTEYLQVFSCADQWKYVVELSEVIV